MNPFALLDVDDPGVAVDDELVARLRAALLDRDAPVEVASASEGEVLTALAALVPDAMGMQQGLGIPSPVTADTLADIGSKHRIYGARTEVPWLLGILRGDVSAVGRLQVERRPGVEGGFALHVPQTGPLTPAAVDASLARAHDLVGATRFTCTSWLLDPLIADELPDTNVAGFARRFVIRPETVEPGTRGTASAAKFLFRRSVSDVLDSAVVVPSTRLEVLVARAIRRGRGWSEPTGTFDRPAAADPRPFAGA